MPEVVAVPVETHYYQFDQQGVAFNMWYLAFVEQARNSYLATQGYSLEELLASGHDIQMVRAEINWTAALKYGDELVLDVTCGHVGTTSFALDYTVKVGDQARATASGVYVIVDGAIAGKAPLPAGLRGALTS
jgi:acyl-CoA thioester hydrolase